MRAHSQVSSLWTGPAADINGRTMPSSIVWQTDLYLQPVQSYAQQQLNGFKARRDSLPWPLLLPIDWGADPFDDANWKSNLQHWRMTDPILEEYFVRGGGPELLREAMDYVIDWHRYHINEQRLDDFSWKDAVTGIRAIRIAFFIYRIYSGELPATDPEIEALHTLADEHLRRLSEPGFIRTTNHGFFQVAGLNLLSKVLADRPAYKTGREVAAANLSMIFRSQFDELGVHREHSPGYHFFTVEVLSKLGIDRHFESSEIRDLLALAKQHDGWLVFPS